MPYLSYVRQEQRLLLTNVPTRLHRRRGVEVLRVQLKIMLTSLQLTDGGKAARAKMSLGDVILSINGISTDSMNHLEAQNLIKACIDSLSLTLQR